MTTTNTLRKLFKKLFNVDVEGNSATAVLDDALGKDISIGGGGGGGSREPLILSASNISSYTFKDVYDAYLAGTPILFESMNGEDRSIYSLEQIRYTEYDGGVFAGNVQCGALLGADSWNGYLHFSE